MTVPVFSHGSINDPMVRALIHAYRQRTGGFGEAGERWVRRAVVRIERGETTLEHETRASGGFRVW